MASTPRRNSGKACDIMYLQPIQDTHAQVYLEAIWLIQERTQNYARVSAIAEKLGVTDPSVIEMLKRLRRKRMIQYRKREGAKVLPRGRRIGKAMARNGRLLEVLMRDKLEIPVDPRTVNGIEHYLTERFADALCIMLNHPKKCPHGNLIPQGKCCKVFASK